MALAWDPLALVALLAGLFAYIIAALIRATAPDRLQTRLIVLVLFVEGLHMLTQHALPAFTDRAALDEALLTLGGATLLAIPFLYVLYLSTLDTPLVRPFRSPTGRALLVAATVGVVAARFVFPEELVSLDAPRFKAFLHTFGVAYVFAFAVAISAYRRATTTAARARAKALAVAFGVRDAAMAVLFAAFSPFNRAGDPLAMKVHDYAHPVIAVVFIAMLAYAILRTHVYDIDLKVRWTVRQSTIAAAFVASFFVVSELAQELFSKEAGPYVGIVAAGALIFMLAPLQRLGERVASAALPGVKPVEAMTAADKSRFYEEQVRVAWEDGNLGRKERVMLNNLRERLGLTLEEAARLEDAVFRSAGPVGEAGLYDPGPPVDQPAR